MIRARATGAKPLIRTFIVDDHPIFAEVLAEMLNRSGDFTVVGSANDGETALKRLAGLAVDIVILDLMLPGMGGWSCWRLCGRNDPRRSWSCAADWGLTK